MRWEPLLIVAVIFISGCVEDVQPQVFRYENITPVTPSFIGGYGMHGCYRTLLQNLTTIPDCEELVSPFWREECLSVLALKEQDTSICEKIENPVAREGCKEVIETECKDKLQNINESYPPNESIVFSCKKDSDCVPVINTYSCFFMGVINKEYYSCYTYHKRLREYAVHSCLVSNPYRGVEAECVEGTCKPVWKDAEKCPLPADIGSDACYPSSYSYYASSPTQPEKCYDKVAATTLNYSLCYKIKEGKTRDGCLEVVASNSNQSDVCMEIEDNYLHYRCLANVLQDETKCGNISFSYHRDICYKSLAISKKDASICDNLDSDRATFTGHYSCDLAVARKTLDPSICLKLDDDRYSGTDYCYYYIDWKLREKGQSHWLLAVASDEGFREWTQNNSLKT